MTITNDGTFSKLLPKRLNFYVENVNSLFLITETILSLRKQIGSALIRAFNLI